MRTKKKRERGDAELVLTERERKKLRALLEKASAAFPPPSEDEWRTGNHAQSVLAFLRGWLGQ